MADPVAEFAAHLGLDVDQSEWNKGDAAIDKLKGGLASAVATGQLMASAIQKAGAIAVEVIKGVAETLVGWGEQTLETTGRLADLSAQTGLSAEALQEYAFASEQSGVGTEEFAQSVTKLSRTLAEAAGGSKDARKALHAAGLTDKAIAKAMKSPDGLDAALMEISDRFADMPDGAKKTALAMQVLGRGGARMIPVLNAGGDGLREMRQEARDLGAVMSNETVAAGDQLGDNIGKLKHAYEGWKNQLVGALFPVLERGVDKLLAWIKAHKELIRARIEQAAKVIERAFIAIGDAITYLWDHREQIVEAFQAGLKAAEPFVDIIEGTISKITTLVGWIKDLAKAWEEAEPPEWVKSIVGGAIDVAKKAGKFTVNPLGETIKSVKALAKGDVKGSFGIQGSGPTGQDFWSQVDQFSAHGGGPTSAPAANVQVNAPITVNPSAGMDEKALAQHTADSLNAELRKAMAVKQ